MGVRSKNPWRERGGEGAKKWSATQPRCQPQCPFPSPRLSVVQEHFEKPCFVQPCVQGSARSGLGAVDSPDLYHIWLLAAPVPSPA